MYHLWDDDDSSASGGGVKRTNHQALQSMAEGHHRYSSKSSTGRSPANDFLMDECGKNALRLAARGSTIVAELLRLSEHIPDAFTNPDRTEYEPIIMDFVYFRQREVVDKVIEDSPELSRLDEEFWQTHVDLLDRFFKLFRSIYVYVVELNRFIDEIDQGLYIGQSISGIAGGSSLEGVQLLCELHHLYGVMLLLLDERIGGKTRERLIVSYIRYRGAGERHVVEVTQLCRSTGHQVSALKTMSADSSAASPTAMATTAGHGGRGEGAPTTSSVGYPAAYFARVPVRTSVVRKLVDRLRSDDIYSMALHYPLPEHRGVAMASQGALLYILLFFLPHVLSEEVPIMNEIVSKHFYDSWVVNYYLGFTADLTVAWASFPAAKQAIARTTAPDNVAYHQQRIRAAMKASSDTLSSELRDGLLTEGYALDRVFSHLLPLLREANASLRWAILHGTPRHACLALFGHPAASPAEQEAQNKRKYTARQGISDDAIIALLLKTAQIEYELRTMFAQLLREKKKKWKRARASAVDKVQKLSSYFAGDAVLSKDSADDQLSQWFDSVAKRIADLQYYKARDADSGDKGDGRTRQTPVAPGQEEEPPAADARRRLQRLLKALENVREFSQVSTNLQVLQYVTETEDLLKRMLRYVNIEHRVLVILAVVSDFSYAWELLSVQGVFVKEIQEKIRAKPAESVQMRAVFVKLSSLVEVPCGRTQQACTFCVRTGGGGSGGGMSDPRLLAALRATSMYYSGSLVGFVRRVLHVIPTAIFETLRKVMQLLIVDDVFNACPSKISRQDMREISQLPVRERLSTYTADIARYASGVLAMESMRIGVIDLDSHQLLEDGVRRELVDQVARELHVGIQYDRRKKASTSAHLEDELHRLGQRLRSIRTSFEYIQDYLNVHGLRIWIEEFARIVNFNVDMEANAFVQRKIYSWSSAHQSESTPIPFISTEIPLSPPTQQSPRPAATAQQGGPVPAFAPVVRPSAADSSKHAYGFLGNLLQHLLSLTDPKTSTYISSAGAWYSRSTLTEVVGLRTFSSIGSALGPAGLQALDRLMCFMLAKDLQVALVMIRHAVDGTASGPESARTVLRQVAATLSSWTIPISGGGTDMPDRILGALERLGGLFDPSFAVVTTMFVRIGRIQLMRRMLENELRSMAKLDSGTLFAALKAANDAVLAELVFPDPGTPQTEPPRSKSRRGADSTPAAQSEAEGVRLLLVANDLTPFLEAVGIIDVLRQLFSSAVEQPPTPFLALYLSSLAIRNSSCIFYDERFSACTPARVQDVVDPAPFLSGLALLLRQFHRNITDSLVACLAQAVRACTVRFCRGMDALAPTDEDRASTQLRRQQELQEQQRERQQRLMEVFPLVGETLTSMLCLLFKYLDRPVEELQYILPAVMLGDVRYHGTVVRRKPQ